MHVSRSVEIAAPAAKVWSKVTDIEHAGDWISGIKKVDVLAPATGPSIIGFKWQETREFMGKDAIETMWVTDANESEFYQTRAESHGSIYTSRFELSETTKGTKLTMVFGGQAVSLGAKIMWALTGWMAKNSLNKTIDQDLSDIKNAVESAS